MIYRQTFHIAIGNIAYKNRRHCCSGGCLPRHSLQRRRVPTTETNGQVLAAASASRRLNGDVPPNSAANIAALRFPLHQELIERFPSEAERLENLQTKFFRENGRGKEFAVWKFTDYCSQDISESFPIPFCRAQRVDTNGLHGPVANHDAGARVSKSASGRQFQHGMARDLPRDFRIFKGARRATGVDHGNLFEIFSLIRC
jgi:hypothetical protein